MKRKYYLRGLGLGILITALVFIFIGPKELSDEEIIKRAEKLGYVKEESSSLGIKELLNKETPVPTDSPVSGKNSGAEATPIPTPTESPEISPSPIMEPTIILTPTEVPQSEVTATPTPTVVPTEAVKPTATAKPTATVKPTEAAKPTATVKPTEAAKPTATVKPTEAAKPTATVKPTEAAKPTEAVKPTAAARPTEAAKPTATVKPTEAAKPTETPKPTAAATPVPTEAPSSESVNTSAEVVKATIVIERGYSAKKVCEVLEAAGIISNAKELRKTADDLDKIMEASIESYLSKINIDREELIELLDNETWLTAQECFDKGFCTEILPISDDIEQSASKSIMDLVEENKKLKMKVKEPNQITFTEEIIKEIAEKITKKLNTDSIGNKPKELKEKDSKNIFESFFCGKFKNESEEK